VSLFDAMAETMKAIVDTDRCEGNAVCMATAPELFDLDDEDQSYVRLDEVPSSMEAAARRAAELCPRMAITLEE
jgi:ferredoxin